MNWHNFRNEEKMQKKKKNKRTKKNKKLHNVYYPFVFAIKSGWFFCVLYFALLIYLNLYFNTLCCVMET